MNIIAFNCNHNKSINVPDKIFSAFLRGMAKTNANISCYDLLDLEIKPCLACTNNIGFVPNLTCQQDDSMQQLYPLLKNSEIWVFAAPAYKSYASASFRNLLDRLEPIFHTPEDFGAEPDDIFYRSNATPGKLVLLSATEQEASEFKFVVEQMRMIADIFGKKFLTPILRDNIGIMNFLEEIGNEQTDIYSALEEAGMQAVYNDDFDGNIINVISKDLFQKDSFLKKVAHSPEEILL